MESDRMKADTRDSGVLYNQSLPSVSLPESQSVLSDLIKREERMGGNQETWHRLFMVPGMGHCRGGDGPNQFNAMSALERWREANEAPAQILATHVKDNNVDMTRSLCPYQQVAVYKGMGSTNDAASFKCQEQ